jgi:hypothetical protein
LGFAEHDACSVPEMRAQLVRSETRRRAAAATTGFVLAFGAWLGASSGATSAMEGHRVPSPRMATFGVPSVYHTVSTGTAFDIASGDFTGTKVKDIVIANGVAGSVSLLAGRGDGTFSPAVTVYSNPGVSVTSIAVGDFNGDGHLDLAIVTEGNSTQDVVVLLGDGQRHFRLSATAPLRFLSQIGPIIFGGIRSIAVGTFTPQGSADIVVTDGVNYISFFPGDGHGDLGIRQDLLAAALPSSIVIADLYGHGLPDIGILDNDSSSVYTFAGHGDSTFRTRVRAPLGQLPVNAAPVSLSAGDLRGNGRTDLFAVYSAAPGSGTTTVGKILLSNGNGSYATAVDIPIAGSVYFPGAGAIADFNTDGIPDLAIVAESFPSQNDIVVLRGNGDGTFSTSVQTFVKILHGNSVLLPVKLIVDDFNADGKPDIAVAFDRTKGMGVGVLLNTTAKAMFSLGPRSR